MTYVAAFMVAFFSVNMLCGPKANAQDTEGAKLRLAQELAECGQFYNLWAGIERRRGNAPMSDQLDGAAKAAYEMARQFTDLSTIDAHTRAAFNKFKTMMGNDPSQFEVVHNAYAQKCKEALESPTKRYDHWLKNRD